MSQALALRSAQPPQQPPGASRIYYIDEGQILRAIHCVRGPDGKYRPTGVEERVSFPLVQATISKAEGRPDLHPTVLGYEELGRRRRGRFRKRLKKVAKKIAKSKILKKVAKGVKFAAAFVPGAGQALAIADQAKVAIKAGKGAAKAIRAVKRKRQRSKLSGLPLPVVRAAKARLPAAAIARAQQQLRARIQPTSAVAKTTSQALLRERRLSEASKALALVPPAKQAEAAKVIGSRVDGYKVITPRGNTVWVSRSAIGA